MSSLIFYAKLRITYMNSGKAFQEPVAAHGHMNGWTAFRQDGMKRSGRLLKSLPLFIISE